MKILFNVLNRGQIDGGSQNAKNLAELKTQSGSYFIESSFKDELN